LFDFSEKSLAEIPVVVLDTETTGLYVGQGDRLTEIGAVRLENWQKVGKISCLVNPQRPISPQSIAISGINQAQVDQAPNFAQIKPELDRLLDGALLVAHKAVFDAAFLGTEYALAQNQPPQIKTIHLPNPWLCTLTLARKYFNFGYNNLGNLARQLGVRMGKAHRALNDALATAEVLRHLTNKLATDHKFRTVGDLLFAQGEPIVAPPLPRVDLPERLADALAQGQTVRLLYTAQQTERWVTFTPRYAHRHRYVPYLIGRNHETGYDEALQLHFILSAELVETP